jgi:antitoxin HigA-1
VIAGYGDKRTRDFARGKRVKAFSNVERAARLKLDRLEAAVTVKDLAVLPGNRFEVLKVPTNRITEILNRRRAITGDTALRLAHFFGSSAEFWLNLQSLYEIRLAEQRSGKSIRTLLTLKQVEQAHA